MKFSEYCDIMQTRGIDELSFMYRGKEYSISMAITNFSEYVKDGDPLFEYSIDGDVDDEYWCNTFNMLLQAKMFDGKTLEEIWSDIDKITFNGNSEEYFLSEDDGLDFVERWELRRQKYLEENGVEQWSHSLSATQSFWRYFPYLLMFALLLPVLSFFNLLWDGGWILIAFFGGVSVIALIVGIIRFAVNPTIIKYLVTDKKIEISGDLTHKTDYQNIKKVTMRKYRGKSGYGTIQIYVKKGLSLNFRMSHVPDVDEVYRLITDNLNKSRQN